MTSTEPTQPTRRVTSRLWRARIPAVVLAGVLALVACGQESVEDAGGDEAATEQAADEQSGSDEESTMQPEGATELTMAPGTVDAGEGVNIGVTDLDEATVWLDVSGESDSVVGGFSPGETLQVGTVMVGVGDLEEGLVHLWIVPGQPLPTDGVVLPVPGQRAFEDEVGLATRLSDPSLAELGVRTDPEAGLGQGWEYVDLVLEEGETAELADYNAEVVEVSAGYVVVRVTAPDGTVLPRS